jgi:hypothetical protein
MWQAVPLDEAALEVRAFSEDGEITDSLVIVVTERGTLDVRREERSDV